MTNNEPLAPAADMIDALADAILNADDDSPLALINDPFDRLADLMPAFAFNALCAALDICPLHRTDLDTCRDDDRRCFDA